MSIEDVLKKERLATLSLDNRHLYWTGEQWMVRYMKPDQFAVRQLYNGPDLQAALAALIAD
jgi:hypothetical protein